MKRAASLVVCAVVSTLFLAESARAMAFLVSVDTSGLAGDAVMAFDFANADSAASHRLDVYDFTTDGSLFVSATPALENCPAQLFPFSVDACKDPADTDVTGTFGSGAGIVSISDAGSSDLATISYYQRITLGSSITFKFEMTGDPSTDGATPDGFAFWLLNPGDPQNAESNPGGDLLGPGPLILYTFGAQCDTSSSADGETAPRTAACAPIEVAAVPEPEPLALLAAALLALVIGGSPATALRRRNPFR
ncbi:MAG TPA: hypothetical protein VJV77_03235 [Casimicrobiaceae bacterium]|nr:hypothetical protein [Casimicrobiaceae bacterium]